MPAGCDIAAELNVRRAAKAPPKSFQLIRSSETSFNPHNVLLVRGRKGEAGSGGRLCCRKHSNGSSIMGLRTLVISSLMLGSRGSLLLPLPKLCEYRDVIAGDQIVIVNPADARGSPKSFLLSCCGRPWPPLGTAPRQVDLSVNSLTGATNSTPLANVGQSLVGGA